MSRNPAKNAATAATHTATIPAAALGLQGKPDALGVESTGAPGDGLYWESKVADSLGLSRERVAKIRIEHLFVVEHFRMVRGEVVLTEAGLAELHKRIPGDSEAAPQTLAVKAGPPARAKFEVTRVPANKHLLYCVPTGERASAAQVLIRVKDNTNFMRGMSLEAIEGEGQSWQYRGRLPRKRGRW